MRLLTHNLIDADNIHLGASTTSGDPGVFSGVSKSGSGAAAMIASGAYTGKKSLYYTIIISSVASGKEVGQAVARWRTNETAVDSFEGQFTTSTSNVALGFYGLSVRFNAGTGDDFAVGDMFYVTGIPSFVESLLVDERRDTYYRREIPTVTESSSVQTLSFATPTVTAGIPLVFALPDYGIIYETGDATPSIFRLRGGTTEACSEYVRDFVWQPDASLIAYLSDIPGGLALTYWQVEYLMSYSAPLYKRNRLWIGQMYLGGYVELTGTALPQWGSVQGISTRFFSEAAADVRRAIIANLRRWEWIFEGLTPLQRATWQQIFLAARDADTGIEHPIWLHETLDDDRLYWTRIMSDFAAVNNGDRAKVTVELAEMAKGYVL